MFMEPGFYREGHTRVNDDMETFGGKKISRSRKANITCSHLSNLRFVFSLEYPENPANQKGTIGGEGEERS